MEPNLAVIWDLLHPAKIELFGALQLFRHPKVQELWQMSIERIPVDYKDTP